MADRNGLKIVGVLFATITLAVMLTTAVVVASQAGSQGLETETTITGSIR
jgi:hypothetical protein